jgi:two-component system heavy metal sensor histidine kinase CusS
MRRLNIRWRLTCWNTAAFAAVLLLFSAGVYGLVRHALYRQADRLLASQFQELGRDPRLVREPAQRLEHWVDEFREHVGILAVVYDSAGTVVARTEEIPSPAVPSSPGKPADVPRYQTTALPILGRHRTLFGRVQAGDNEYHVVLMTPLREVDEELGHILTALWLAVPLSLVLAGGVAYGLARKALAPVERLRMATDEITADRLDQRLAILNPADELGCLATTLNNMIARLEESFARMKRFTADVAHELRTPLAVVRNEAEVTLRAPRPAEEHRQVLENILVQTERLTNLVDQLLFLCRHDAGLHPMQRQRVAVGDLLYEAVDHVQVIAEEKGLALRLAEVRAQAAVLGDPDRLRRVFINLLHNAVKYTSRGGEIAIECQVGEEWITIAIRDTGAGIPAEHLPHLFERFYRADPSRTGETGGTGLGLSICETIVKAHRGRIQVRSAVNQGTEVSVTLPIARSDAI